MRCSPLQVVKWYRNSHCKTQPTMSVHRRGNLVVMVVTVVCTVLVFEHVVVSPIQNMMAEYRPSRANYRTGQTYENVLLNCPTQSKPGKTLVYRFDGTSMQQLHEFCTWTVPFDCVPLKTPSGPTPIHIHDIPNDLFVSKAIKNTGQWEPTNIDVIYSELNKDPELGFMDLGSHVGCFSLSAAKLGRKVVSVDPLIENVQRLCKSIQKGGFTDRMTIIFNPLGANRTVVNMRRIGGNIGASRVVTSSESSRASTCQDPTASYTITLDDMLPYLPFKKAVIKMDLERYEFNVISGSKRFFKEIDVQAILMEWVLIKQVDNGGRLVDLLLSLNYSAYQPRIGGQKLDPKLYKSWPSDVIWKK